MSNDFLFIAKRDKKENSDKFVVKILNEFFKIPISEINIKRDYYGKPYVCNNGINYNVSHTDEWIAMIVSNNIVGIDIEKMMPIEKSINDKILKNVKKWTIYESYTKAIGKGINIETSSVSINTNLFKKYGTVKANEYPLFHYRVYKNIIKKYWITVCTIDKEKKIKIIYL